MTTACLNSVGTVEVSMDRLIILVITGESSELHYFNSLVGIGSKMHCLLELFFISLLISSRDCVLN